MVSPEVLRANFTISDAAKAAIEQIRKQYDAQWPDNPAAVAMVGWSIVVPHDGGRNRAAWSSDSISARCWPMWSTAFRRSPA